MHYLKIMAFAEHNPMSLAMQKVLDALEHHLDKETDTLNSFYESVECEQKALILPKANNDI